MYPLNWVPTTIQLCHGASIRLLTSERTFSRVLGAYTIHGCLHVFCENVNQIAMIASHFSCKITITGQRPGSHSIYTQTKPNPGDGEVEQGFKASGLQGRQPRNLTKPQGLSHHPHLRCIREWGWATPNAKAWYLYLFGFTMNQEIEWFHTVLVDFRTSSTKI